MRLAALLFLLLAACGDDESTGTRVRHWYLDDAPHAAKWSYQGDTGPSHWGDLDPAWRIARTGKRQSPIDFVREDVKAAALPPIVFRYGTARVTFVSNGHTVKHEAKKEGYIDVGGKRYVLKQFHFHTPSEHTVDGEHADIELHLVHEAPDGEVAVVSVLGNRGKENARIAQAADELPVEAGEVVDYGVHGHVGALLPTSRAYWTYTGSFTTPPCTEGVRWFVLKEQKSVDPTFIDAVQHAEHDNNRPVQPLNGRVVKASR